MMATPRASRPSAPGPLLRERAPRAAAGLLAALALAVAAPVAAQADAAAAAPGTLTGIVVHDLTLAPVAGAQVLLLNSSVRAVTGEDGFFRLEAPAGTLTLKVEAEGYVDLVEEVEVAPGEATLVQLHVPRLDAVLEEILVSAGRTPGLREHGEPRSAGAAQPADRSAVDLLARGVPGVWVTRGDGGAGSSLRIIVRGITSVALSNEPEIYVNGVRVSSNDVLDNIPARDVERIRVLSGASAGPRFASAGNGIILIETRRGPGERPR